jgi:ATP-binding cassette subfamily C (CFTR/MRP) protein 1
MHTVRPLLVPLQAVADSKKKVHSASLNLSTAIWEYCCEARWSIFCVSLFIFLSCQASRQLADYFIRWWTRDYFKK